MLSGVFPSHGPPRPRANGFTPRATSHCAAVQFWVESEDGRVKLKLRPKN